MAILRVRVNISGLAAGPALSTFYFEGTGQIAADAAADAAHEFYDDIKGQFPNYGSWTVDSEVDELQESTGILIASYAVLAQTGVGTSANEALPGATQGLLRLNTGVVVNGRQLKGHLFIPGPTEAANTVGGVPTSAYATVIKGAADVLISDPASSWVVWSRTHGVAHPITVASVWNKWAVLRSRRD